MGLEPVQSGCGEEAVIAEFGVLRLICLHLWTTQDTLADLSSSHTYLFSQAFCYCIAVILRGSIRWCLTVACRVLYLSAVQVTACLYP